MPRLKGTPPTLIQKPKLQRMDGIVKSVYDCRKAYPELSPQKFARWYEDHFGIKAARVLNILANQPKNPTPGGAA